jgi:hypothetical protein
LRRIRSLVFLLVVVWVVAEFAVTPVANRMIEQRVAAQTRGVEGVKASVGTFPVVTRFILTGRVPKTTVTLDRVERLALTFAQVRFDLTRVEFDRTALLKRQARITAIDNGTVTATLDIGALPAGVARLVSQTGVRMSGRTLLLGSAGFQMSPDIMPCNPDVRLNGEQVVLSCTIQNVPPVLLEGAQRR